MVRAHAGARARRGDGDALGDMLDEFRDITSARQIPMFKGDQWEITVPALLEAKEEVDAAEAAAKERDDDVFERPPYHAPSAPASSAAASAAAAAARRRPRRGRRGLRSRAPGGQVRLGRPRGQGTQADAQPAGPLRRDPRAARPGRARAAPVRAGRAAEVVNTRQAVLHFCQAQALQFNLLRYAQFSTMRPYRRYGPRPRQTAAAPRTASPARAAAPTTAP